MTESSGNLLLEVEGLEVHFGPFSNPVRAVKGIDFKIFSGDLTSFVQTTLMGVDGGIFAFANW